MKAVIQRVKKCSVRVGGKLKSEIASGILILLGVHEEDTEDDAGKLADKCVALRIFDDGAGKMNFSVKDTGGSAMVVPQFTLYGDARKGNRPNYMQAAKPELAERLYDYFVSCLEKYLGEKKIATGIFQETMDVELTNYGPVTIIIETKEHA
ncbi:MAG: D-aminoacyl-tRNA deacylase [Candidatus Kryptoniota bacterium]